MESGIKNIQWLETLRTLAMLGVIIIHVSTPVVKMTYGKSMEFWWIGNIMDSAVRFSVPLFLMLSGATMLGKEYKLVEFYQKRFWRVLLPFLFWMVIYWVYRWMVLDLKVQPHEPYPIFRWGIDLFLKEGISKHFWYIYMILCIYLFVPFIGKRVQKLNLSAISFILTGWIILTFACKTIPLNLYNWSGEYLSKFLGYFLYTGYLLLGYYLCKLTIGSISFRIYAFIVFILSMISSAGFTYFFSKDAHHLDLSMYNYLTINTIIQSIAIFILVKNSSIKNQYISRFLDTISNYSYGIYLVHILVIGIFFQNGIFWTMAHPLISIPLLTVMTLFTSFIIIYLLRKIPFGKFISG